MDIHVSILFLRLNSLISVVILTKNWFVIRNSTTSRYMVRDTVWNETKSTLVR